MRSWPWAQSALSRRGFSRPKAANLAGARGRNYLTAGLNSTGCAKEPAEAAMTELVGVPASGRGQLRSIFFSAPATPTSFPSRDLACRSRWRGVLVSRDDPINRETARIAENLGPRGVVSPARLFWGVRIAKLKGRGGCPDGSDDAKN